MRFKVLGLGFHQLVMMMTHGDSICMMHRPQIGTGRATSGVTSKAEECQGV